MSPLTAEQAATLDSLAVENFRKYLQIPSVHPHVDYVPAGAGQGPGFAAQGVHSGGGQADCGDHVERQRARPAQHPAEQPHGCGARVCGQVGASAVQRPHGRPGQHLRQGGAGHEVRGHPVLGGNKANASGWGDGAPHRACGFHARWGAALRLLTRDLIARLVLDEEIGGVDGMRQFVHTEDFKGLNVGFALDEGMASPDDAFPVFYGERNIWHLVIHFPGTPGHGSLLLKDTAGEKVALFLNTLFEFRRSQVLKLAGDPTLTLGDVTTVNLTQLKRIGPAAAGVSRGDRCPISARHWSARFGVFADGRHRNGAASGQRAPEPHGVPARRRDLSGTDQEPGGRRLA
ncbi:hypothetical protein YQE_08438, partial [Dendroctonus ponderosae]